MDLYLKLTVLEEDFPARSVPGLFGNKRCSWINVPDFMFGLDELGLSGVRLAVLCCSVKMWTQKGEFLLLLVAFSCRKPCALSPAVCECARVRTLSLSSRCVHVNAGRNPHARVAMGVFLFVLFVVFVA